MLKKRKTSIMKGSSISLAYNAESGPIDAAGQGLDNSPVKRALTKKRTCRKESLQETTKEIKTVMKKNKTMKRGSGGASTANI